MMSRVISKIKPIITVLLSAVLFCSAFIPVSADSPTLTSSKSAFLYCLESDTVLFTMNEDQKLSPGVLTKLMVAVVTIEEVANRGLTLDSKFEATKQIINKTKGKHISMKNGENFRVRDLIAAIIHTDADDAAYVLADGIADNEANFVELMNLKAEELGMTNTRYYGVTATFDILSYTTAEDQIKLASYAMKIYELSQIASEIRAVIPATNKSGARYYGTTNYLLTTRVNEDYYLASATGFICGTNGDAGYCGVLTSRKDGLNYIAVVMGAENLMVKISDEKTETDEEGNEVVVPAVYKTIHFGLHEARALLEFGENAFSYVKAVSTATPIAELPVRLGNGIDKVAVLPEFDLEVFVPNSIDKEKEISYSYVLDEDHLTAPIKAGQRVGTLYVKYKGELLGEVPLITKSNVEQNGYLMLLERIKELLSTPFIIVLIAMTVFAAIFYVLSTAVSRQNRINEKKRQLEKSKHYLGDGEK
jgi:D-alanyl-D-alanine carboxypeptidase (penicillin-binding protein 5/6)